MKMGIGIEMRPFIENALKGLGKAGITDDQKLVFFSNATFQTNEIQQFVVLQAPNSYLSLRGTIHDYDGSLGRVPRSITGTT